jgi:uncharacterized protein (TIGR02145 family)
MRVQNAQTVYLKVQNLAGQVLAELECSLQPGENEFSFSVNASGIYVVSMTTGQGTAAYKVMCTETTTTQNNIVYKGSGAYSQNSNNGRDNPSRQLLKSTQTSYTLGYTAGDIILYRCRSGIYTTILTDSPVSSKNYPVEFVGCTDPDNRNYSVVKIGDQTWMAENLALLPTVHPSKSGSETTPYYYVYGYEGSSVSDAKVTANYATYGVLYNWIAAGTACPSGWHLPSDADWTGLTDYLGASAGGKMKETGTVHWSAANVGATNSSGFTALPGGARQGSGGIIDLGMEDYFWSSTASGTLNAWYRGLEFRNGGFNRYNDYRPGGYSVRCLLGVVVPVVATAAISEIAETTASGGGTVSSDGGAAITARGVCWNTTGLPVIADNKTNDGTGSGSFSSSLSGLAGKTTYHVRSYAVNSAGTGYGNEQVFTTTEVVQNDMASLDGKITAFMNLYNIPGASLAVSKNGKLVYMKGYGFSDRENNERVVTADRFRLASVSKTYTAVGIMKLIQDDIIKIDDKVFGAGSILGTDYGTAPYNEKLTSITVQHLLQHTTGAWGASTGLDVIDQNPAYTNKQLMDWIIDTRPMTYTPGTFFDYSNINYFILARIIEKVTGETYFDFIKSILATIGASETDMAGKTLAERKPSEVKYYGQGTDAQYVYNIAFPRRVADGGIITTAKDLLKLVTAVDGFASRPDIFTPATLTRFITPSSVFANYACGIGIWSAQHLWFNNGSLPGTRTWFMRDDNGMCVALLFNSRPDLDPNNVFTYAMQDLCLDVVKNANYHWQDIDQF